MRGGEAGGAGLVADGGILGDAGGDSGFEARIEGRAGDLLGVGAGGGGDALKADVEVGGEGLGDGGVEGECGGKG